MLKKQIKKKKKHINTLKKKINYHNYLYHTLDNPKISDVEYDKLFKNLNIFEKKYPELITTDSPTKTVGSLVKQNSNTINHKTPMLSLNNVFNDKEYLTFNKNLKNQLNIKKTITFCCELKIDGLAVNLIYKKGKLIQGITRGNGFFGEDITENIKTIHNIPTNLIGNNIPNLIEIRGEVFMQKKVFDILNKESYIHNSKKFSNTRNAAAGSLRQIDPNITAKRQLDFYCYGIGFSSGGLLPNTHYERLIKLKSWGFPINNHTKIITGSKSVIDFYYKTEKYRDKLDYNIDGIVIKINSIFLQNKLGFSSRAPKWAIAFKYNEKEKTTLLEDVKFQIGRTGAVTPVAKVKPIKINGVIVTSSTLHNANEIKRLDLHIGDTVIIKRAGNVIPKITGVVKNKRILNSQKIMFPTNCPICKSSIKQIKGESISYCTGWLKCKAQLMESLKHFVSRDAMNIKGIGDKIIEQLIKKKHIKTPVDLYNLNTNVLSTINGIGERLGKYLIKSIEESKKTTLSKFVYALGIRDVGEATSINLSAHFNTLKNIMKANELSLRQVYNIGDIVAKNIVNFFNKKDNQIIINELIHKSGILFIENEFINKTQYNNLLTDKNVVLSGYMTLTTRDQIKNKLIILRTKISKKISKKTDILIIGKNASNLKLKLANEFNIKIINEYELINLLNISN